MQDKSPRKYGLFINGKEVDALSGRTYIRENPASEESFAEIAQGEKEDIDRAVEAAQNAFEKWKKKEILERCDYIRDLAKILTKNKDRYAKIVTEEMGKPITQAIAEIEKCGLVCEYYSENAEAFLRDEIVPTEFRKSFISFEPLGVVAGIMPWNFPFWQVMRYAVPTLIAGCRWSYPPD